MEGQRGGCVLTLGDTGLNGCKCGRRTEHGGPRRPAERPPVNVVEAARRRVGRCRKEAAGMRVLQMQQKAATSANGKGRTRLTGIRCPEFKD